MSSNEVSEPNYKQMYEDLIQKYNALFKNHSEIVKMISNLGLDLQVFAKNSNIFAEKLAAGEIIQ